MAIAEGKNARWGAGAELLVERKNDAGSKDLGGFGEV